MNIKEMQKLKKETENKILKLIQDFEVLTDLSVKNIDIEYAVLLGGFKSHVILSRLNVVL